MIRDIEDSGASVSSSANREEILYTADVLAPQLPKVVGILADAITAPRVVDYQLDEVRTGVREDSETQLSDGIIATVDALHTAAYREAGLGLSPFASSSAAQSLGVDEVKGVVLYCMYVIDIRGSIPSSSLHWTQHSHCCIWC